MARARVLVAAGALFRDEQDRVLLVEPAYKDTWEIPGGVVDEGESPRQSCRREIGEELGLDRDPGRLLVVDYCRRPYVPWEGFRFIFAGGLLSPDEAASMRLPADELLSHRFVPIAEIDRLVAVPLQRRLAVAVLIAGEPAATAYLEDGILAE